MEATYLKTQIRHQGEVELGMSNGVKKCTYAEKQIGEEKNREEKKTREGN